MANYHSIIRNWGEAESTFDTQLALGALEYKQQKYDANSSKIQETLNNYGNIGLLRDEEKQKLYNNLSQMVGTIEGVNGLDLSSNKITNTIMAEISKTIDEDLIKHHSLYKNKQKFDEVVSKKQSDGKGGYDERNVRYAEHFSGYEAYIRGEADSFSGLEYLEYADPQAAVEELQKGLKTYINDIKEKAPYKDVFYRTEESKELTRQRILDYSEATLPDNVKKQIEINTWAEYQAAGTEALQRDFIEYTQGEIEQIDLVLDQLEIQLKSTPEEGKERVRDAIEKYTDAKERNSKTFAQALEGNNEAYMSRVLGFNRYNESLVRAFAIDRNEVLKREIVYQPSSLIGGDGTGPKKGEESPRVLEKTIALDPTERDTLAETREAVTRTGESFRAIGLDVYNTLSQKDKDLIDKQVDQALGTDAPQDKRDEMTALKLIDFSTKGEFFIGAEDASKIDLAYKEYKTEVDKYDEVRKIADEEVYGDIFSEMFKEGVELKNLYVYLGDGYSKEGVSEEMANSQKAVSVTKEFTKRGINRLEDLYKKGNEDLRAAIAVEVEMNGYSESRGVVREGLTMGRHLVTTVPKTLYKNAVEYFKEGRTIKDFRDWFFKSGEEIDGVIGAEDAERAFKHVENIANIYENNLGVSRDEAIRMAEEVIEESPKGMSRVSEPMTSGYKGGSIYEVAPEGLDKILDLKKLQSLKTDKKYEEIIRRELNERSGNLERGVGVVFDKGSKKAYDDLYALTQIDLEVSYGVPLTLIEMPNGEVEVRASKEVGGEIQQRSSRIFTQDMSSEIVALVDFNRQKRVITADNFDEKTEGIAVFTKDINVIEGIADMYNMYNTQGDIAVERTLNPDVVRDNLLQQADINIEFIQEKARILGEPELYNRITALVPKITDSENKRLKVGVTKSIRSRHRGVQIRPKIFFEKDGREYKVFEELNPIEPGDLTEVYKEIKYHPQKTVVDIFLSRLVRGEIGMRELKMLEEYYNE